MDTNNIIKEIEKKYEENNIMYNKDITLQEILKLQQEQLENLHQDFNCNQNVNQVYR